jgi:CHAD domain-containing protein
MARPWKIVDLDPNENLKTCLHKVALTRFQETFSYEQGTMKGEDTEALHDMRVAARRLRAVLRIFGACFPKKKFKKQDDTLKGVIRCLGSVRESDVFIDLLRKWRAGLTPREGRIIDQLIAREETGRLSSRKQLLSGLRRLQRTNYAGTFQQFLKETLS